MAFSPCPHSSQPSFLLPSLQNCTTLPPWRCSAALRLTTTTRQACQLRSARSSPSANRPRGCSRAVRCHLWRVHMWRRRGSMPVAGASLRPARNHLRPAQRAQASKRAAVEKVPSLLRHGPGGLGVRRGADGVTPSGRTAFERAGRGARKSRSYGDVL